jgi:L-aminopeptidase/D-esterase-like protein
MIDGDSIYAFSCGKVKGDVNVAGTLAAEVMAQAIATAVKSSQLPDAEFLPYCR